eukprot:SAG25_NODE_8582_length_414_cov_3.974603_1_plen_93_part_01
MLHELPFLDAQRGQAGTRVGASEYAGERAAVPPRPAQRSVWPLRERSLAVERGDPASAETGLVLMRWRGAGDVAASQGLADGQAIAAKHRQGD